MATVTVKTTCSLDAETERELESLARRWNTSKSAALRRAIQAAAKQAHSDGNEALGALDRLQSLLALDQETAGLWADEVRQERRAALRNTSWTEK
ncbi:MAG: ribbon-helix-helix protein, CopG family [Chromatiales bacterium]|nr:ribbon-helix-helix protein, CopG family [Chromatiales bacterium]